MGIADGVPIQHFFLTIPKAPVMTGDFGQKSLTDPDRCLRHASVVSGQRSTLSSESVIGHRPDDDFGGKPNKKSSRSTNDSPFA